MTFGDIDPGARSAIRRLRSGSLIVSLLVALSLPVTHWFQETGSAQAALEAEGDLLADTLSQMATRSPAAWALQHNLLEGMLARTTERQAGRAARLLATNGQLIVQRGNWARLGAAAVVLDVLDSGASVARLELQSPLAPVVVGVASMAVAGLGLGLLVHLLFSRLALSSILQTLHRLSQARVAAERAGAARAAFLATMSHEIRTPMNGVIGMTSLLAATPLSAAQRHYVDVIRNSGDALLGVINEILEFSKVESGRTELEPVRFQPEALAEDVVVLLGPMAAGKKLDLACRTQSEVPVWAWADASRIRQVLINLVGNAVKFTSQGEVVVTVSVPAPGALCFEVRDTGIGIPPEQLEAVFDAFRQGDSSTTRRFGGTGLGLAISRRLAQALGGDIAVSSVPDQGSVFRFSVQAPATDAPPAEAPLPDASVCAGRRVLIVDDHPVNLEILQTHCEGWGMHVSAFGNPVESLRRVDAGERFDLAVLDFNMAGMDGVALARALRERMPGLPMVLLSSSAAEVEAGLFAASLPKPTRRSVLLETLRQTFGECTEPALTNDDPATAGAGLLADRLRGVRLLLAEDNPVNALVVQHMLGGLGLDADHVGNGLEAVEAIQRVAYDLVLMDMQMPELDGLEATRRIRALALPRQPHVVALTANALVEDRNRCLDAGMDGFLSKPLKSEELYAYLSAWAADRRA